MNRRPLALILSLLVLLLATGAAVVPVAAAPGGNSDNAHRCQQDGWRHLRRADDTPFANQGDCVRYGAHGGVLEEQPRPDPRAEVHLVQVDFCQWRVEGSGFLQDYGYRIERFQDGMFWDADDALTNDTGALSGGPYSPDAGAMFQVKVFMEPDNQNPMAVSEIVHC